MQCHGNKHQLVDNSDNSQLGHTVVNDRPHKMAFHKRELQGSRHTLLTQHDGQAYMVGNPPCT